MQTAWALIRAWSCRYSLYLYTILTQKYTHTHLSLCEADIISALSTQVSFLSWTWCCFLLLSEKILATVCFGRLWEPCQEQHTHICKHELSHIHTQERIEPHKHSWMTSPCFLFYGGIMAEFHGSVHFFFTFWLSFSMSPSHTRSSTSGLITK